MVVKIKKDPKPPVWSAREALVFVNLLLGKKKKEAAKAAGIHPQRVSEMISGQHFAEAIEYARRMFIDQALGEMSPLIGESVAVIARTLKSGVPALEFAAAKYNLDRLVFSQTNHEISHAPDHLDMPGHTGNAVKQPAVATTVKEALQILEDDLNGH